MKLPKPYYDEDGITIYCGDCRDILPHLPKVDLVLTDPPYGIFKKQDDGLMFGKETIYSTDKSAAEWDNAPDFDTLSSVISLCKKYIIWGGNYLASKLGDCKGPLVWDKMTGNNSYADCEIAWANVAGTCRIFRHQWCGVFKDSERGRRAVHPTQKPIQLMSWCLSFYPEAKTVLDPFMGSGTTLVAAKKLGLQAIGIEISEEYCRIAVERLAQKNLFAEVQP